MATDAACSKLRFDGLGASEADQVGQARHDVPDTLVDPGRVRSDEHLVVPGHRLVDLPELQHVGGAIRVLNDAFTLSPRGTPSTTSFLMRGRSEASSHQAAGARHVKV
jgi:hypothetical protein